MVKKILNIGISLSVLCFANAFAVPEKIDPVPLRVIYHENEIEDRLSIQFSTEPACMYAPTKEVAHNNNEPVAGANGMKTLRYLLTAKPGKNFENLCKSATIFRDNYEVTMVYDERKQRIVVTIKFNDAIGFQCERFASIKDSPTISFVFIKRSALAAINKNSKNIFNTAYYSKKKVI